MDIEWLNSLETRVRGAAERLRDLKEENGALKERIRELEERLAAAGSGQGWEEEREEIRRRVEALTRRLEELSEV